MKSYKIWINPLAYLWIACSGTFKLCLCSKPQLGRDVCLWRVLEAWILRAVGQEACDSVSLLSACVAWGGLGCDVWCAVVCACKVKGRGLCVPGRCEN